MPVVNEAKTAATAESIRPPEPFSRERWPNSLTLVGHKLKEKYHCFPMHGQHGSKCFTVAAAVLLLFGSALIDLAQAQGATASAAPTAVSSATPRITPGVAAIPTPTATVRALPSATATPQSAAAATSAPLSKIDHVLLIRVRPAPSPNGAKPAASIPQAASRPEARQTPGAMRAASSSAP